MSSISSLSLASYTRTQQSPLDRLKSELNSEVQSGTVSSTDQTALSSALDDIDQAMQADRTSSQASGSSGRPSHDAMTTKIDSLISSEVDSGKLTSDQASELKNVFANAFKGGPGGAGGAGGPPPGGPGGPDGQTSDDSSTDSSSSTSDLSKLLADFLSKLKDSLGSTSGYTASGNTSSQSGSLTLLIDYQS